MAERVRAIGSALTIWLTVGFSLGWYYTFTYYGRHGWPMPLPEPCAALILYYFSVLNVATEIQAFHWMLVFPLAAFLWHAALWWTARWMGLPTPSWAAVSERISWAAIPLAIPGPAMAYLAGTQNGAFHWERMFAVALRRGNITPGWWLTPLFFGLGLVAFALQIYLYRTLFPAPARQAWKHYPLSIIALTVVCAVGGALAGWPLRLLLE